MKTNIKHFYFEIIEWVAAVLIFIMVVCLISMAMPSLGFSAMTGLEAHEKYIYPVVRVSQGYRGGGSGTVIYSKPKKVVPDSTVIVEGSIATSIKYLYSTYILTNHHVISGAISITEKWDTDLQKNVKKEKRSIVYVEIFKYRDLSTPVGTLKVEAEIVLYNEDEDVALIRLRSEDQVKDVATLSQANYNVMDETVAVGCSLGWPPLPTGGVVTRKNFQVNSLPFHMSSSSIIYGNSGGAMFLAATGELIGIPSMLPVVGWGTPITHMALFIPIERIMAWLETEHYDFIYDSKKNEKECLELRKKEIEAKKKAKE